MDKETKPIYVMYNVTYNVYPGMLPGKEKARVIFTAEPKSEKIEIKYAKLNEPEKLLTYSQLNHELSNYSFEKGKNLSFFIVNEKTSQKIKVTIPIEWKYAPNASGDVTRSVRGFKGDLSKSINEIGG